MAVIAINQHQSERIKAPDSGSVSENEKADRVGGIAVHPILASVITQGA
jgi:hypothetical protein